MVVRAKVKNHGVVGISKRCFINAGKEKHVSLSAVLGLAQHKAQAPDHQDDRKKGRDQHRAKDCACFQWPAVVGLLGCLCGARDTGWERAD